jgi:hypothetical protein
VTAGVAVHSRRRGANWSDRVVRTLGIAPAPSSSPQFARRAYVVIGCGAPLPQALRLLLAAEPAGAVRAALLARLLQLRRRRPIAPPRWTPERRARTPRHAPASLRVLDELLAERITRAQALADWRIELLSAGLAHVPPCLPEQALGTDSRLASAVARRSGDQ